MEKILNFFIEEPHREFYVRELAKKLRKSPTTISKYLKEYEKKGILKSEDKLNHLLFKANTENRNFKQSKLNYNIQLINNSGLLEFLEEEFNYPQAIILFGSFAKAENTPKSDIDILVISSKKKEPYLVNLEKFREKMDHEIQLFAHTPSEIKKLKQTNKELVNNWINGIVLYGYFEVLK
jgi:predicted nucleotidyltransferase